MLSKIWKKVGLIILIIACLWNIISKIGKVISFKEVINELKDNFKKEETTNKK